MVLSIRMRIIYNVKHCYAIWIKFGGYLLRRGTIWNDLKLPTTSKKQPEMTYNEQETVWNDLQQARNNLKQPTKSKKWL